MVCVKGSFEKMLWEIREFPSVPQGQPGKGWDDNWLVTLFWNCFLPRLHLLSRKAKRWRFAHFNFLNKKQLVASLRDNFSIYCFFSNDCSFVTNRRVSLVPLYHDLTVAYQLIGALVSCHCFLNLVFFSAIFFMTIAGQSVILIVTSVSLLSLIHI